MLCAPMTCGCSFASEGLVISGSGNAGDPLTLEPAGPGIVETSADVSSPFLGQTIYETATGRLKVYDGTNWVIYGGAFPGVSLLGGAQSVPDDVAVHDLVLGTEVFDTDAFHSGTAGLATIPSAMGGIYIVTAGVQYEANATGYRAIRLTIANNTGVSPAEPSTMSAGGAQSLNTANNGQVVSRLIRLRAAATLTASTIQTSGGNRNTVQSWLSLTMWRHEPGLV